MIKASNYKFILVSHIQYSRWTYLMFLKHGGKIYISQIVLALDVYINRMEKLHNKQSDEYVH